MTPTVHDVKAALREQADPAQARHLASFFKTGIGGYGEGDRFLGLRVPHVREVAKHHNDVSDIAIQDLLASAFHEDRLCALVIITNQFRSSRDEHVRAKLWRDYLAALNAGQVNNWDLVDVTAPYLGEFLLTTPAAPRIIEDLANSTDLWHQRASILVTWAFIRQHDLVPTYTVVEKLLGHPHDLIHKAGGWMLRETGKRDIDALRAFLGQHVEAMPRTMLRYSIEKMTPDERAKWLSA